MPISLQTFSGSELALAAAVALSAGCFVYWLLTKGFDSAVFGRSASERQFRNVFAIMDEGRRQSLIRYYMDKYACSREEAMRRAIDERNRDANRW